MPGVINAGAVLAQKHCSVCGKQFTTRVKLSKHLLSGRIPCRDPVLMEQIQGEIALTKIIY